MKLETVHVTIPIRMLIQDFSLESKKVVTF